MKILGSVRRKIWFCVNVALLGFLVAIGFALYSNHQLKDHLSHIRDLDFHLAMRSAELLSLFETQQELYKESFMYGLPDSVQRGNDLAPRVMTMIDTIAHLSHDSDRLHDKRNDNLILVKNIYQDYAREAAQVYPPLAQGEDASEKIVELQSLAAKQQNLNSQFRSFVEHYRSSFDDHISSLILTAERSSYWLGGFFFALLILIAFIVNIASTRMLIAPLAYIKEAVRDFGQGRRKFPKLETMNPQDDIGELGLAFLNMAKELETTTVSKAYVDSILSNMNDSLIVTSDRFLIRRINQATAELLGYQENELLGQNIALILKGFSAGELAPDLVDDSNLLPCICSNVEKTLIAKNGHEIPVLLSTGLLEKGENATEGLVYVAKDITERKIAEQELEQLALYDFLTGLPNRLVFNDRLRQSIQLAQREGWQFGLMFIDLDRFKTINDTLGHAAGDTLLKTLSHRLDSCVRGNDTIARFGGDEFAVILENISTHQDIADTARRLLAVTTEPVIHEEHEIFISLSIGIAIYPLDAVDTEELLENADIAMYQAKQGGGSDYRFFSGEPAEMSP
ncbi:MAG: diguanylate cyclase [Desulfuromonas sp.]|nr:diguanylate cyclase [Desulfuromonas sp.]